MCNAPTDKEKSMLTSAVLPFSMALLSMCSDSMGASVPSLAWIDLQGLQSKMKKLHNRLDEGRSRRL